MRRTLSIAALVVGFCTLLGEAQTPTLPMRANSIRFAVMGDTGTGDRSQYQTAATLVNAWKKFPFTFVIMLGDNMYGSERPQDYARKFERPYAPLLQGGVEFYAALGNHDDQNQRYYKPFNMNGERYHTFKKGSVRFFVLDSNYMDPDQVKWLERELIASGSDWKIPYFHHPLYSSGQHGPEVELRAIVEPLFIKHGVDVAMAGHEHFYERVKPQKGIWHFTVGGSAKLRSDDIDPRTGITAKGFDTDLSFMLVEIDGNEMFFQTISRTGQTVDEGKMTRREVAPVTPTLKAAPKKAAPKKVAPPAAPRGRGASLPSTPPENAWSL